jgi:hypothetical protein
MKIFCITLFVTLSGLIAFTDLDLRDGRDMPSPGVTAAHDIQPSLSVAGAAVPYLEPSGVDEVGAIEPPPVTVVAIDGFCTEWVPMALEAGWETDHLERLDYVLWRESRCQPDAFNGDDPNSGSYGLMQINGFWCRPTSTHPDGWLQAQGLVNKCSDLYVAHINLAAARAIYDYADARGCGWLPWTTRNTRWCS